MSINDSNPPVAIAEHLIKQGKFLHLERYTAGTHYIHEYAVTDLRGEVVYSGSAESVAQWWATGQRAGKLYAAFRKAID